MKFPVAIILLLTFEFVTSEIHRAKTHKRPVSSSMVEPSSNIMASWFDDLSNEYVTDILKLLTERQAWICSVFASSVVGLSGVFPLFVISKEAGAAFTQEGGAHSLQLFLSFAVGGLLGDVFLHLLPEAWSHSEGGLSHQALTVTGLWILAGIFTFFIIEIMCESQKDDPDKPDEKDKNRNEKKYSVNGNYICMQNGKRTKLDNLATIKNKEKKKNKSIAGYLNLLANGIDNFSHGLAVAGSFLVSFKVGILTTFAILLHEIPHEIGDFAILLKSGFNRLEAAKAQLYTATIGIAGAVAALMAESAQSLGDRSAWILPFTAGGFINIALINVLPQIMKEENPKESLKQIACIIAGVGVMWLVTILFE